MAGVGFELKKLFRARTAVGHVKAYAYASVVTTGPFLLMTGMVLAVQLLFSAHGVAAEDAKAPAWYEAFSIALRRGWAHVFGGQTQAESQSLLDPITITPATS